MKIIVFIKDRIVGFNRDGKWNCIRLPNSVTDIYSFVFSVVGSEPFTIKLV